MMKNNQDQKSSLTYTLRHHRIQVLKVLAHERFKSNMKLAYQIIVSAIKFRKDFAKVYDANSLV